MQPERAGPPYQNHGSRPLPAWYDLPIEEAIRFYAEALAQPATPEERRQLRRKLAKSDLFYLLTHEMHRADIARPWLFDRCREVQAAPDGRLDLWAREHYKSTIITVGLTIQDILNDPEVTCCIFSHNKGLAQAFLLQIKVEFENNADLRYLFDDVLWDRPRSQASLWSVDEGLVVKRTTRPKEPTLYASGLVDGMPTGKHFSLRVYDDVVTEKSVTNPEKIKKTTGAWELSDPLGTEDGRVRYVGTRYHQFDTYREMMKRKSAVVREHPATSDGSTDVEKSVLMSPVTLAKKRRDQGQYTFGCQMLLNPQADSAVAFKSEWLIFQPLQSLRNLTIAIICDPSGGFSNKSDYSSFWVLGFGADEKWRVIDLIRARLNLLERQRTLFGLHRQYKPRFVGYEKIGMQADIEHFDYVMKQENYSFTITPLGGLKAKNKRIERLIPLFEAGRIIMPPSAVHVIEGKAIDMIRAFVEEEYSPYPVLAHDDMLDGLSRIEDDEVKKFVRPPRDDEFEQAQHSNSVRARIERHAARDDVVI